MQEHIDSIDFEEKKRHNQEMRTTAVKSFFRKTPTKGLGSPKSKDKRATLPESHLAIIELDQFLQTLPQNAAHHAYSFLRMQAKKLDVFDKKLKTHSGFMDLIEMDGQKAPQDKLA
ncbi:hypothetical protein DAPPUDRAFT_314926 [Daphnia pulex]|uniref:Uncharacterized protein n=1 Tax=Daphnia pulex TaxID=6669 RepID=E9G7Y8_DAPPU|nr:hypothetical protein DAPPUDRAFT_314926 [Daphnia pulex]|eukprot:EFX84563.1 hypothetical protein DAPPUDRAFT_314926 [Daphnia pulex]